MSAWAVFSMMGFYPDCPGNPSYTLTVPRFDRIEISVNPQYCAGKDRIVIRKDGWKPMKSWRLTHTELIEKGEISIPANL